MTSATLPDDFVTFSQQDELVLLSEGVYMSVAETPRLKDLAGVYVVKDELVMRGLPENPAEFGVITQHELVQLVLKHLKSMTW